MAADGQEGVKDVIAQRPDLVILDIMMPGQDGWETCRQIRVVSDVPVIMLTSLRGDEEIVRGLSCGADDFVSKPFKSEVLLARARAVLRRVRSTAETDWIVVYRDDHLFIDLEAHQAQAGGKPVNLTPTEFRLLVYMFKNAGRLLSFEDILENVWGPEYLDSPNYVHVYVAHLRQKLEKNPKNPQYFLSEHGGGYRFVKQNPPAAPAP
jgi:two-component system KDP operon response regulator KdpE